MPNPVAVKLAPAPNTTSASCTCWYTAFGMATPPEPSDSGWVFRKRALALEARGDRRFEQLSDLLQLIPATGIVHALSGIDERALRLDERRSGRIDIRGSRAQI